MVAPVRQARANSGDYHSGSPATDGTGHHRGQVTHAVFTKVAQHATIPHELSNDLNTDLASSLRTK